MPNREEIEREYRELSARLAYAEIEGEPVSKAETQRYEQLAQQRVRFSAPDFSALIAA